jgi:hypothetical protein
VTRRVFLTCWLAYSFLWTPYIVREHFPAVTLAEEGSLNVQHYLGWTDDIFVGPHGGAYINNNPGASLAGAIPLILLRPLLERVDAWNQTLPRPAVKPQDSELFWRTLQEGRAFYFLLITFLTVALVMAPVTAGTAAYLCSRAIEAGLPAATAALVALFYGLGTPMLFRSGILNHNLLAGDAGFYALLVVWGPHSRPLGVGRAVAAGLLSGYAFLCDYSGAVVVATVALYVWLRCQGGPERWRILAAYAGGVLPGVAALAGYQAWAFGAFFRPPQHFMTPTAPTARGYRGFDWPSLPLLWANFVDPRFGLFAYCPALLLAFAAPFVKRARYRLPDRENRVLLIYFGLFVLFCAANQYSWLQPLTGFRYLAPVVPGLALLAMQAAQAIPKALRRIVGVAAGAQSLILAAAHENDIRLSVGSLVKRHFTLFWMVRLHEAGAPVTWIWTLVGYLAVCSLLVLIWTGFRPRTAS